MNIFQKIQKSQYRVAYIKQSNNLQKCLFNINRQYQINQGIYYNKKIMYNNGAYC